MQLNKNKKKWIYTVLVVLLKLVALLTCLYFFICSLSFLSTAFRILGGRRLGDLFSEKQNPLLRNPVVGTMIGILATVLVQSSSTSTSIIVGLVSAGAPVRVAIPMIMGANIGTSVTNTIVSLSQIGDTVEFGRAFACATVHDMFNWLSVIILLIVETITGYLEKVTEVMVKHINLESSVGKQDFLKLVTKPFTSSVIRLNKKVLKGWANSDPKFDNVTSLLKTHCKKGLKDMGNLNMTEVNPDSTNSSSAVEGMHSQSCTYLFAYLGPENAKMEDVYIGVILLVISLILLCGCLLGLVKILNSLLSGNATAIVKKTVNANIPNKYFSWVTGYIAMLVGAILTVLVQSSSVFTSTLTPLAGMGLITLERSYPMTLGSNIGTTTTSLLASFATCSTSCSRPAIQIALVHLLFNITGILIFYPVPVMRWPIPMAQTLGNTTAKYRWFAMAYLIFMFFVFPGVIFGLSLAGAIALYIVLFPAAILLLVVVIINVAQKKRPTILPEILRSWEFLPLPLRSLQPVDSLIWKVATCGKSYPPDLETTGAAGTVNKGFKQDI